MWAKTIILTLVSFVVLFSQNIFKSYFSDSTLRIDYYHLGNSQTEQIVIDRYYLLKYWSGTTSKLIDPFNNGNYYLQVLDSTRTHLLFSRGFNSYFGEYQTTEPAKQGKQKVFQESALIPFPKKPVLVQLLSRDKQNKLHVVFEQRINPQKIAINKENRAVGVKVLKTHYSGPAHKMVDIVLLSEGYTAADSSKFKKDLLHYTQVLLKKEPFKSFQNKINIYGVFKPSAEAGCDEPSRRIFKNTILSCTFNSMGSYRYLLTEDLKAVQDLASAVPHDAIIIMVNHDRYGGGGIYNFYMDFTTDNRFSDNVFIHEFGHSFAGLADEYYAASTAYDEFYPVGVEPTEPNITRLLDPENLKWKDLVQPGTPIPTPWHKQAFDRLQMDYQKKRQQIYRELARLSKAGADSFTIAKKKQEAIKLAESFNAKVDEILNQDVFSGKVGAFEGAGYVSQGMYRPMLDCVMFRNGDKPFCKVCAQRIREVLQFLSE